MSKKEERLSQHEEGLLMAMRALDNQVAREWQKRSPAEREIHGVQKWEPIAKRVENLSVFVLDSFADESVGLDSLLILAQTMAKSLQLIVDELGEEGLGEIRRSYCASAAENILRDMLRMQQALKNEVELN